MSAGASSIAAALPRLAIATLRQNRIGAAGAIALCRHGALVRLSLTQNQVRLSYRNAAEVRKGGRGQLAFLDLRNYAKGKNALLGDAEGILDYADMRGIVRRR